MKPTRLLRTLGLALILILLSQASVACWPSPASPDGGDEGEEVEPGEGDPSTFLGEGWTVLV